MGQDNMEQDRKSLHLHGHAWFRRRKLLSSCRESVLLEAESLLLLSQEWQGGILPPSPPSSFQSLVCLSVCLSGCVGLSQRVRDGDIDTHPPPPFPGDCLPLLIQVLLGHGGMFFLPRLLSFFLPSTTGRDMNQTETGSSSSFFFFFLSASSSFLNGQVGLVGLFFFSFKYLHLLPCLLSLPTIHLNIMVLFLSLCMGEHRDTVGATHYHIDTHTTMTHHLPPPPPREEMNSPREQAAESAQMPCPVLSLPSSLFLPSFLE